METRSSSQRHGPSASRARLGRVLAWLCAHPLVWLVPLLAYGLILGWVVFKLGTAPRTEFIYDI